ncbi:MAG: tetratricopeptide repeat protein [Spirochaetes bacterium]|nr:tetratricopeptide repeat protein [Spirochaetota bacterium]
MIIRILMIIAALSSLALLDPYFDNMDRGNRYYNDKKYTDADDAYDSALEYMPSDSERPYVDFNKGAAQYKAGNYDGAIDYFKKALNGTDTDLQKRAFYNLGNSYYKKGDIEEALEHYMNAIRVDPDYDKPKQNIEALLKEQKEEEQKSDQNNEDDKQKKDQNEDDESQDNSEGSPQSDGSDKEKESGASRNSDRKKGEPIEQKLSQEQIDNILNHFKQRPVQKGKGDGRAGRSLEKNW